VQTGDLKKGPNQIWQRIRTICTNSMLVKIATKIETVTVLIPMKNFNVNTFFNGGAK
jgi:hypothetical protein